MLNEMPELGVTCRSERAVQPKPEVDARSCRCSAGELPIRMGTPLRPQQGQLEPYGGRLAHPSPLPAKRATGRMKGRARVDDKLMRLCPTHLIELNLLSTWTWCSLRHSGPSSTSAPGSCHRVPLEPQLQQTPAGPANGLLYRPRPGGPPSPQRAVPPTTAPSTNSPSAGSSRCGKEPQLKMKPVAAGAKIATESSDPPGKAFPLLPCRLAT